MLQHRRVQPAIQITLDRLINATLDRINVEVVLAAAADAISQLLSHYSFLDFAERLVVNGVN